MRLPLGVFAAIVLICAALVSTAPAAILERLIPEASAARLAACAGSLFRSGTCRVFLRTHSGWQHAGALSYAWNFGSGRGLHVNLDHDGRQAGTLQPSLQGWRATAIALRTPIMLPNFLPLPALGTWQATGHQIVTVPYLACNWGATDCAGRVRVAVIALTISQLGPDSMGSYAMDFDFLGEGRLKGQLSTISGPLTLDGQMEKSPGAAIRFVARAKPGAGVSDELQRFLGEIAQRDGPESFVFSR